MPTFQHQTADGKQLGQVELGRPDWPQGSVIYRGDGPILRVLERLDEAEMATLVVEEAEARRAPPDRAADALKQG